jgi:hypothetical protein
MANQVDISKSHCNRCQSETNHHVIFELKEPWEDRGGHEEFEILKCCGCDNITVRNRSLVIGVVDCEGRPDAEVRYFPPATSRKTPKWLDSHEWLCALLEGHFVPKLLNQIYTALFNDALALAAMGIRALLERTMIDKCGDQGSFPKNLEAFRSAGFIGQKQVEALKDTLELGHASIHRNFDPSAEEIHLALDITEGILAAVYVHSEQSVTLKKRIPPKTK